MGKKLKLDGLFGAEYAHRPKDILSQRFLVPPFSVLSTREGQWQQRKRQWVQIGLRSELGRGYTEEGTAYGSSLGTPGELRARYKDASPPGSPRPAMNQKGRAYDAPIARGDGRGQPLGGRGLVHGMDTHAMDGQQETLGGTSIFDPVLCELVYRWFCPPGGSVLDPFAGGSVRGVVAGELGLHYTGIDLSATQLEANRKQAKDIGTTPCPTWINGDSLKIKSLVKPKKDFNLLFSCPPYGDLEKYSDAKEDLSAMSGEDFDEIYSKIIVEACGLLAPEAFACFVVGDYRDRDGYYRDLPGTTIRAFKAAGLHHYNTCILVNVTGSLPLRIDKQFRGGRKLGTCHQTVLVFCKGQPTKFVKTWPALENMR